MLIRRNLKIQNGRSRNSSRESRRSRSRSKDWIRINYLINVLNKKNVLNIKKA